jgi:UDP:flavonoid glycosyltransferase YjiC (YdhE family)
MRLAKPYINLAQWLKPCSTGKVKRCALRYSLDFCQQMVEIVCQDAPKAIAAMGIEQVLTTDFYRNNARKIQESIQQSGGVKQAANIIEQVTQSKIYQVVEA